MTSAWTLFVALRSGWDGIRRVLVLASLQHHAEVDPIRSLLCGGWLASRFGGSGCRREWEQYSVDANTFKVELQHAGGSGTSRDVVCCKCKISRDTMASSAAQRMTMLTECISTALTDSDAIFTCAQRIWRVDQAHRNLARPPSARHPLPHAPRVEWPPMLLCGFRRQRTSVGAGRATATSTFGTPCCSNHFAHPLGTRSGQRKSPRRRGTPQTVLLLLAQETNTRDASDRP